MLLINEIFLKDEISEITIESNQSTTHAAAAKSLQSWPTLCNPIDGKEYVLVQVSSFSLLSIF